MTEQQFCYWLQGFCELHTEPPTKEQWQSIREHLQTVFVKVTPPKMVSVGELLMPPTSPPNYC